MCINRWMLSASEEITLIDVMHRLLFICSILAEMERARGAEWQEGFVFPERILDPRVLVYSS